MTNAPRLSDRVGRLRQLQAARGLSAPSPVAPLPGEWPQGCEAYQASFAQARLWFLHQLEPELTAYHLPAVWKLRGDLDVPALERALEGLIERHFTLRTSFRLEGSEVIEIIHPAAPFALAGEALGERDAEDVIKEWLEEESRTPFDLTAGLLLRARLLKVDGQEHVLLINHHHIASDGWSRSVLARDLVELYKANRTGRSAQLEPLSVQYHDYAAWQRQRLSGERLRELNDYWIGQLRDLEPLELPSDHPRPVTPSYRGESVCFQIKPALLEPFEELCRGEGATLQMGLLAVVALLLHRYSRQEDFAIGVPIWGRKHPELEKLIGFFINTLPIRTRFEPGLSFRQLLALVRESSIGAYDHQELPFEQMVEALNVERDTSRNPLVQVMLQLIELPEATLEQLDGLAVQSVPSRGDSAKVDLSFDLRRSADQGLSALITYATDVFDGDRIERLRSHLITLLSSVVQAPDQSVAVLNLLPEAERQLIESWQQGPVVEVPDLCVHELFEQQVERTPEAIALVFEAQEITYSELNARANQLAHHLIGLGVGPDVIVAVCLERSIELVVALLAILKAGGAYLPLDPAWPSERLGLLLRQARPALMLTSGDRTLPMGSDRTTILLRLDDPFMKAEYQPQQAPDFRHHSVRQLAYLTYTSGSTGVPKGVLIEHRGILRLLDPGNSYAISGADRVLQLAPLAFDAATFEIWGALLNGATLVMAPQVQLSLQELAGLLRQQRISTLWLTAGLFQAMVEEQLEALASVRQILAGGDVLAPGAVQRLLDRLPAGHQLINGYGPTENTTFTCCHRFAAGDAVDPGGLPIGRPIAATVVRVLDRDGHPCPIGVPGELHIGGAGLARGYLNNPGLTAETFIADPLASNPGARLYRSGDLVSWNPDGTLAFHGRIDQQIKLRGFRIEPVEIETLLLRHPAVAQAAVVLRLDDPANPRLIAYWVPQTRGPSGAAAASAEQLRVFLAERLPDYMVPAAFVELEALPLTPNGKVDRKALPAPSFSGDEEQRVAPSTDLERQLHAIWAEVLGHGEFGVSDNFFLVGGHSLAAARLVSRIEQSLGSAPPLAALFHNPTIAGLCALLVGTSDVAQSSAAMLPAPPLPGEWPQGCEAYQASFAQARLWFLHQLEPELTAYHLPAVWKLRGDLDVPALERALEGLIERHFTLRTSFRLEGSEVIEIIHPAAPFALAGEALGERDAEDVIKEWLEEESRTPFDLTAGLLLRARLLKVDGQEHVLLINHHHIASDGWSRSVLARDLVELYKANRTGRSAQLEPLSVQYHDYAAWQRQRLSGERLRELNDYWIGQLRDLEPLELPSDHPRPVTPSYRGESVCFQIKPALLEPFEELCRGEGATLQMGLLAVVALLLHRYSRQEDFAIGVPIWGRKHPELEKLIGFFINTLPIRTRFEPGLSFRQLLALVRESSIGAYDHQELPFEQMVEALNVERDTSRNPLVQVMLQLIELPEATLEQLDGLAVQSVPSRGDSAKVDLSFDLRRSADQGLSALITYATDVFDGDRIERLRSHLITLLSSVVQAPDQSVAVLNLLPEAERQLIESWQQGPVVEVPDLCVHELFEQQVERTPEAIALVFEAQEITYSELNARANQLAHHLIGLGVGPDVIVAVCLERSIELVVALLAILKAGGAYLPLDPAWPSERLGLLLRQARPALMLTSGDRTLPMGSDRTTILLRLDDPFMKAEYQPQQAPDFRHHSVRQLAYLTYTSGSTGVPKGVLIEHRGILRLLDPGNSYAISGADRVLQLAPLAFDAATFEIWGALLNGATLVMAPQVQLSLQELAGLLRQQRISTLWLTAGLFQAMVEEQLEALASVRQILAGGDVLAPGAVQRLLDRLPAGHQLINGYGPTENTTFTCCHRFAAGDAVDPGGLPIGRPIAATVVRVLDRDGHPCPIGVPGELHIGGAGLARGYLNNPGLTAETFIADPLASNPGARLYRSGDLVSWNPDGTLAFHGRIDQQIKLRGFRIEPVEIETLLLRHPAVAQAAVVLRLDDPANPRLIAYWVPQTRGPSGAADDVGAVVRAAAAASSNQTASAIAAAPTPTSRPSPASPAAAHQLRSFLAERLPDPMVPSAFVALAALPLTTNGKLDRNALPAPSFSRDQEHRVDPRTERERELHAIWADVLGHDDFGITDNFFHIGGHSLAAARLIQRINDSGIAEIGVASLFQHPTIADIVQLIDGERPHDPRRSLVTLQPSGEAPPLFVIHGGAGDVFVFLALAKALAPDRPVHGLQAIGLDGNLPRHTSVEQMAAAYAAEIRAFHPSGPYHLIGYSAGGWYTHAVAAALLRLGGSIGLMAVVDTSATADLHRRVRAPMVAGHLLRRLPVRLRELVDTGPSQLGGFLHQRASAMHFHLAGMRRQQPINAPEDLETRAVNPTLVNHSDYYVKVQTLYRPPRLPVAVDVISTRSTRLQKEWIWRFYARRGVRWHPVLDRHDDFFNAALMPPLADLLRHRLREIEAGSTTAHPRSPAS